MSAFSDWLLQAFPEQGATLLNTQHPALALMEAAYHDGGIQAQIRLVGNATRLAMRRGQVVGESRDYYITLSQLGALVQAGPLEERPREGAQ